MPGKIFELADFGEISIIKRAGNRNIRLSIKADGKVMVTMPAWASYRSGLAFAESKLDWLKQQTPAKTLLKDGQAVGKNHHLQLLPTRGLSVPKTLVSKTTVVVRYPITMKASDPVVQDAAETACIRALRKQAAQLLPQRLQQLADEHGFDYASVGIKRLKGRWGSCDQHQNIVLNLFLMQLPWECIDYVLLHELTHTRIMRHGPPFWDAMQQILPNLPAIRKQMRLQRPVLQ
jgi:predicted metal-dependent hydrolase